ncbi:MAG: 3-dehydroquinate synthase [Lachnospiraceae bacterium]|nr:3-dehydroquinate synthase [Lachnospiraceae bacterium]
MVVHVNLAGNSYDIIIEKGCFKEAGKELNLDRKVFILTDSGVPKNYAEEFSGFCKESVIYTVPSGEESKSLEVFKEVELKLLSENFTRKDCVVAIGGGVVGDLAGFCAASYMRGIDFYNIPTTVLSQVDSSVGGKTAVNLGGVKNIVGAFYQPKKVLIDPELLKTLPKRQISNGLAEAVKMALTFDEKAFASFEKEIDFDNLTDIIGEAVKIKAKVVEEDEKEAGLRKVLNFGHTAGHGFEVASHGSLLHGEAVGLGMLIMCGKEVRERLEKVLKKLELPLVCKADLNVAVSAVTHDKKSGNGVISTVYVQEPGSFEFRDMSAQEIGKKMAELIKE